MRVAGGHVDALNLEKLDAAEREKGYVLACQSRLVGDVTLEVPAARVGRKVLPRDEALRTGRTATPMESPIIPEFNPMATPVFVQAKEPDATDNMADFERIVRTLRTDHDIYPVSASLEVFRELPVEARKDRWRITACLQVMDANESVSGGYRLRRVIAGHHGEAPTAIAIDIGTTSIWGEMIDLERGTVLARASRYNPQIAMGDDVISRIVFALKKDGLQKLQGQAATGINEIIDETLEKSGRSRDSVSYVVAAGNTVMTHLFLALYPKYLRETPYVPVAQNIDPVRASVLGLHLPPHVLVWMFPSVASYVGGDIVSGVLANGMWQSEEMTLFIDIGTNGEIVAGNRDLLMTASCSAGPAFEGGGLEHGMRAAPGAIEGVLIDPDTFQPLAGMALCLPCPLGTTAPAGATACTSPHW